MVIEALEVAGALVNNDEPWDEPPPLKSFYVNMNDKMHVSNWVLLEAKDIQICVGLLCWF